MWISIFGNAAIDRVRGGDEEFAEAGAELRRSAASSCWSRQYPASDVVITVATFVGLLFYVTSADSGALVMANLCSRLRNVQEDGAAWHADRLGGRHRPADHRDARRSGGIFALQYATVIIGLPFAIVMVLVMWGLLQGAAASSCSGWSPAASTTDRAPGPRGP